MIYLIKTVLALFLLSWSALGVWMTIKYATLFGPTKTTCTRLLVNAPLESPTSEPSGLASSP